MSDLENISNTIAKACEDISTKLNGRIHPNQEEIIRKGCKKHKVNESHIRLLLNIDAGRRSSRYFKTVKATVSGINTSDLKEGKLYLDPNNPGGLMTK